jgi:hypothetical protein
MKVPFETFTCSQTKFSRQMKSLKSVFKMYKSIKYKTLSNLPPPPFGVSGII